MNKLPTKWCIRMNSQEAVDYTNIHGESKHYFIEKGYPLYAHYPSPHEGCTTYGRIVEGYTEITLEDFKKLVLKEKETMTKQDFTIEGTEALKKAFVEESGLTDNYGTPWNASKYMTSRAFGNRGFDAVGGIGDTRPIHFILPSQWEEALQYVKEYFAEDEFKVGDWVVVTDAITKQHRWSQRNKSVGHIFQLTGWLSLGVTEERNVENLNNGGEITSPDNKYCINYIKQWLRKATPEEIAAIQTKTFKLGYFTAVVSKDKVTIADRSSVTISECIKWFEKEFNVGNDKYSSLGEFAVTENTYTLNLGCVKNVPVKDIEEVYKYLKTL